MQTKYLLLLIPPFYSYHCHPCTDSLTLITVSQLVLLPPSFYYSNLSCSHIIEATINHFHPLHVIISSLFKPAYALSSKAFHGCLLPTNIKNLSFSFLLKDYSLLYRATSYSSGRKPLSSKPLCLEDHPLHSGAFVW